MRPSDHIIIGSLCYAIREDAVLLMRRKNPPHVGFWSAPGGKLELGESPDEGVIREMREETGLFIKQPRLCGIVSSSDIHVPIHWLLFIYRADQAEGVAQTGETEEGELRWIALTEVNTCPMPRADQLYLPRVLHDEGIFRAKFVYDTPATCREETFYA